MRRGRAAASGAVAVAFALAVGELLAAVLDRVPSLVTSVGSLVVPLVPPAVEDWAIATFGTADKAALAVGTVVLACAIGAATGVAATERPGRATGVFGVFGLLGYLAALAAPLTSPVGAAVTTLVATSSGILVLSLLLAAARPPPPEHRPGGVLATSTDAGRRRFLAALGGAALAAAAAASAARWLARNDASLSVSDVVLPPPRRAVAAPSSAHSFAAPPGLTPIVVPNRDFFRIDTALFVPRVDAGDWTLRIHGLVTREFVLTYDQLLARPLHEAYVTVTCVSNEVGGDLVGNARWLGTPLAPLLEEAGVRPGAGQVVGRAIDGWTAGFPIELAFDGRDAMVAVGMNSEPLPEEHGFPARLIVPGLYGYVSATKWLTEIELTTWEGFDAYWVPRGWAKEGPIRTQSRIDVPRDGSRIEPGDLVVAGVAWAPTRGIREVEVQVDAGPWQPAELTRPLSDDAWVQWRSTVTIADVPTEHRIRVRATDGTGQVQPEEVRPPRPDGATGWHTIRVRT